MTFLQRLFKSSSTFGTDKEPLGFPMSPKELAEYQSIEEVRS